MKAIWKDKVLAESNETIVIENNHYFPPQAIKSEYFEPSNTHTFCPWKGEASYYNIKLEDAQNTDAAWFYPEPKPAANQIKDYIAFWKGVHITK